MKQIHSETDDLDISSAVAVVTATPGGPGQFQAHCKLGTVAKPLDGTGGNFVVSVTVGGHSLPNKTVALAAGVTLGAVQTDMFVAPASSAIVVKVLSPNAADDDVTVTGYLMDIGIPNLLLTGP